MAATLLLIDIIFSRLDSIRFYGPWYELYFVLIKSISFLEIFTTLYSRQFYLRSVASAKLVCTVCCMSREELTANQRNNFSFSLFFSFDQGCFTLNCMPSRSILIALSQATHNPFLHFELDLITNIFFFFPLFILVHLSLCLLG